MTSQSRKSLLVLANLLIPIAVITFAVGFFPYKAVLPGLASYRQLEYGDPPTPPFDKVVFMVVDALRSDFVYSNNSGFKFTQNLIRSGNAIPFTAHATSPTITMPRVKAITTGSIPSFLDVILNFAESDDTSTLANQDTWLAQIRAKPSGRLVMYGDDTWLRLFPGFFDREDGTTSFFVSDFTEVDHNVTRHVPDELENADWNAMILHYLGLDHIGHKTGPLGPNMIPKQSEMDGIVEKIYEGIENKPHLSKTLLVLLGDHGMNEGGNHGGSAPGETSPALVFISPQMRKITKGYKCPTLPPDDFNFYRKVEQSDIAPTLAGLLGFPIPQNNLGVFIPEFFEFWDDRNDSVQLLLRNALQILDIVKATFSNDAFSNPMASFDCSSPSTSGDELACKWRKCTDIFRAAGSFKPRAADITPALQDFCSSAQSIMSSTASNYNMNLLAAGIALIGIAFFSTLVTILPSISKPTPTGLFYSITVVLYGVMMFASSFVEEEQHIWYWMASAWCLHLFVRSLRSQKTLSIFANPLLLALFFLRVSRRYNQTGQKHAGAPDIAHSALITTPSILWPLILLAYALPTISLVSHFAAPLHATAPPGMDPMASQLLTVLGGGSPSVAIWVLAVLFKVVFTVKDAPELVIGLVGRRERFWLESLDIVALARILFLALALAGVWVVGQKWLRSRAGERNANEKGGSNADFLLPLLEIFLLTQTRAQNIPLFLIFHGQYLFLSRARLSPIQISLTTLLLTHASFFALGNSNAISSIDLSSAYNGVKGYNVVAVGALVFAGNWAGPLYWGAAGVVLLRRIAAGDIYLDDQQRISSKDAQTEKTKSRSWVAQERSLLAASARQPSVSVDGHQSSATESPFLTHITLLTLFTTSSLLAVMAACTALRTHLFIWTVFSPKYLYAMAWGVLWHGFINVGLGALLWVI